ncbi:MAG TPA: aminotransferase class V-fold PLP-dependent enzyme, partial [Pirellulaceae bacterium]|nr:aminotransferase class V-fold PLP-dependent enzyme [Pirellulaceae bacterium]
VDVGRIGCHLLAAPGHKGLLGQLGTGVLYVAPGVEADLLPLKQGGTGTRSEEDVQPNTLPDRYESGNLNALGIVGLEAGVSHVLAENRRVEMGLLTASLVGALQAIPGLRLYGPLTGSGRLGVVSFNLPGYDPQELAALLDANWSIQSRAGIHCAPRMHAALGTSPAGTLRLSLGHFTAAADIDAAIAAIREVASAP